MKFCKDVMKVRRKIWKGRNGRTIQLLIVLLNESFMITFFTCKLYYSLTISLKGYENVDNGSIQSIIVTLLVKLQIFV